MKKSLFSKKRGSVLLGAVGIAIVGATVISGYLSMSLTEYKLSHRTLLMQSAMNLAESGLEEAMDAINLDDWTGWTAVGTDGYYKSISGIAFSDSHTADIKVYVEDYDSLPIMVAEGRIAEPNGDEVFKQVRVDMDKAGGLFANGLTAKDSINFNGNNVSVDAYDSTLGLWNATLNRLDEGSVASTSVDNGAADIGNGDIWGYLATGGGAYDIGNNGSVRGADTPAGVDEDPDRIAYDFSATLPDVDAPGLTVDYTTLAAGNVGDSAAAWSDDPVVYHVSSFSMNGHNHVNVVGPTVIICDGNFSMSGQSELNIIGTDSYLELYVGGDLDLTGQGVLNQPMNPEGFQVWGTAAAGSSQTVKVAGNGDFAGIIYAPNGDVEIKGNGNVSGAAVGEDITLTGNAAFHYDVNLANRQDGGAMSIGRWRELRGASEHLDFTSTAALASSIAPL